MIDLVVTNKLSKKVIITDKTQYVISLRRLSRKEISFARQAGMRRYFLPSLSDNESAEFFREFDQFWDQLVQPFGADHPFWRNAVSSKMQEWENSAAYLALILFTLSKKSEGESLFIIIVCASLEEQRVCEDWGKKNGWNVLRKKTSPLSTAFHQVRQEIINILYFAYRLFFAVHQKYFSQKIAYREMTGDKGVLIASSFYTKSFSKNEYFDPFFGKLHYFLAEKGFSPVYLCIPLERLSKKTASEISAAMQNLSVPVYIAYALISWADLLAIFLKTYFRRHSITECKIMDCDFTDVLRWNMRRFDNTFTIMSEIFFITISQLCKSHRFDRLIVNYEGNVFERSCMQAYRKYQKGLCIGYCQGMIYPLNLKLRLTPMDATNKPEADIHVCTGPYSRILFAKVRTKQVSRLLPGCALRQIPKVYCHQIDNTGNKHILVAMDGVNSTAAVLDWLMGYSHKLQDYQFIIRPHPNVPLQQLLGQCFNEWPDNFHVSQTALQVDIRNSMCVLYRQTSVGLQALLCGVPAVHLAVDLPIAGDPLVDMKNGRWRVSTSDELVRVLQQLRSLAPAEISVRILAEKNILDNIFTAPSPGNLSDFLYDS